ncbi:hypothetical protein BV25DRAFT_1843216 [Artomyces pyxidatus]|uniref:Uncharacterized protein n=1 Tax=Artomyces pyxidatus TaxID=48021 RepID=A0ACB8SF46_9AGAM|nr:hypothetical protein BV25DRAFT_1843216 [Artomyces pyxidatus]
MNSPLEDPIDFLDAALNAAIDAGLEPGPEDPASPIYSPMPEVRRIALGYIGKLTGRACTVNSKKATEAKREQQKLTRRSLYSKQRLKIPPADALGIKAMKIDVQEVLQRAEWEEEELSDEESRDADRRATKDGDWLPGYGSPEEEGRSRK